MIRASVHAALNDRTSSHGTNNGPPAAAGGAAAPVLVTAWSYAPLLPLRVDNRAVTDGEDVSLLIVHAPAAVASP